ncbi:Adrenodoxin [Hortaea werneckii]|uniref:2Fe-2S ferredoxin-type domain-containing protein n=2 Tax=Hortaea werneckii TaxID=91943 RepID=A0A3M7DPL5_HORWE|nr:Adrenodoxin [Hortaea werneckii]KAI7346473.1 Adrenodoxin [Hortaea werneckii]KAI7558817.1 Adrenodoxin [Hortaea werneckii]KAI7606591.1 Adrenodoxin [Hortaea werneckii]KAI7613774.1 Adrenodoxin [Hortaea werneckii]
MIQRQSLNATMNTFSTISRHATRRIPSFRIRNEIFQQRRHLSQTNTRTTAGLNQTTPRLQLAPRSRQILPTQHHRAFSTTDRRKHGDLTPPKPGEERRVTYIDKDQQEHTFEVADGDNLLDIAQANDIEMEGACGGSCACSTCHVIVQSEEMFDKMEEPSDDENDMLDLAFGLTETSRLGCQVLMNKELDGLVVKLPSMTRNMQASDFAEKK